MRFTPIALFLATGAALSAAEPVDFNRDIRPILSDNCFYCHGNDANHRKAKLRLDVRDDALAKEAFVPGKPDESALVERIFTEVEDDLMPPPDSNKKLTDRQKEVLKLWVAQGAPYQQHWSYEKPVKAEIPGGDNGIDHLVGKRLAVLGLRPSSEADRRTLIRRLHADLTGLPPHPDEVAAFVADRDPEAYGKLVERILKSPHFGERMAIGWLDVVRYADTIGYHSDVPRNVWPYRDWVIASFNGNKPFDRFTIEQVAGDLVPGANLESRVGSAFNRLLLTTEEGGAQAKDYEQRMLTDRVRAVGAAWLGQTTGCAQCHDHKFDPFTQRDFYALGAFFADIKEAAIGKREEGISVAPEADVAKLKALDVALAQAGKELDALQPEWEAEARVGTVTVSDAKVAVLLKKEAGKLNGREKTAIRDHFRAKAAGRFAPVRETYAKAERARNAFAASIPKCLVSESAPAARVVRILPRGNWMDESGEIVKAALPHYLPQPLIEGREPNRLDLAHWLVSRENPLTARTVTNRLWKQFFGTGLSKVLDDLGAQGELPPNQPLLDWLACEFMDSGWDVKHIVRTIVMSRTYRQVSTATPELVAADPYNRELARQSPFRLDAELVRDTALSVSGLLVPRIGGPSVKPYQPDGYWENLNFPTRTYPVDSGESQYRRGLYTWWQRTFLHPSLLAFDAPSREECAAERNRSNIPQQALVLLNDPTYVEAARAFAARILAEGEGTPEKQIVWAWQQTLQREPTAAELKTVGALYQKHLSEYREDASAAGELITVGQQPAPKDLDPAQLAAWTHVARVLLNLHETITRS